MSSTRFARISMTGPHGPLDLVADDDSLVGVYYEEHHPAPRIDARAVSEHAVLARARVELDEYFAGHRERFDVPLAPVSRRVGTQFQKRVWEALESIPYGETWSYGDLARAIERPSSVRAVGAANGRNPLSIVVPCHRVIGAGGSLTGYAGGLEWKRWLLALERGDRRSATSR